MHDAFIMDSPNKRPVSEACVCSGRKIACVEVTTSGRDFPSKTQSCACSMAASVSAFVDSNSLSPIEIAGAKRFSNNIEARSVQPEVA